MSANIESVNNLPADFNAIPCSEYLNNRSTLVQAFKQVRAKTESLAAPLSDADQQIQSMPDASPTRWHLAHTTWFFETLILKALADQSTAPSSHYEYLYNSYYNAMGRQYPRARRGNISQPDGTAIRSYRQATNKAVVEWLELCEMPLLEQAAAVLVLGLNHEQQHQELLLTDIKHGLFQNPAKPAYSSVGDTRLQPAEGAAHDLSWLPVGDNVANPQLIPIGHRGETFAYDNEQPTHQTAIYPFQIARGLVSNAEYLEFMADDGYNRPLLWLSDGWDWRQQEKITAPLYWFKQDHEWWQFTLHGPRQLEPDEPLCHISFFEAEAFANWSGHRLPTESESEWARRQHQLPGAGQIWEWTRSAYAPYPGFVPYEGAAAEYNSKFMINQQVLRGSSVATASGHSRPSYRNFFYPTARWQFSGLRLARGY